jgi:AcrR family transcriptional regulator
MFSPGMTRGEVLRYAIAKAGVSVGSLYQYFPNKAAILFRPQSDEWRQTTALLRGILEDVQRPPLERLRNLVHAFICSECAEARMLTPTPWPICFVPTLKVSRSRTQRCR